MRKFFGAATLVLLTCASAFAQQTTGTITGRVVDQQGAAIPGATVTAKSPSTGFARTEATDAEGVYRLSALPVGIYDVTAELQGFTTVSKKDIEVNVAQTQGVDFPLKVAQLAETDFVGMPCGIMAPIAPAVLRIPAGRRSCMRSRPSTTYLSYPAKSSSPPSPLSTTFTCSAASFDTM